MRMPITISKKVSKCGDNDFLLNPKITGKNKM